MFRRTLLAALLLVPLPGMAQPVDRAGLHRRRQPDAKRRAETRHRLSLPLGERAHLPGRRRPRGLEGPVVPRRIGRIAADRAGWLAGRAGERHRRGALPLRSLGLCPRRRLRRRRRLQRGEGVISLLSGWLLEPLGYTASADHRHPHDHRPGPGLRRRACPGSATPGASPARPVRFAGYTVLGRLDLTRARRAAAGLAAARRSRKARACCGSPCSTASPPGSAPTLVDWVRRTAEAESNYWQGFTARQMLLVLVPVPQRRGVGYGRTVPGGGADGDGRGRRRHRPAPPVRRLGAGARADPYRHGLHPRPRHLVHGGRRHLRRADHPRPRRLEDRGGGVARMGRPTCRRAWRPSPAAWAMPRAARTTGAARIFMLLADVEIRRATNGAKGLEDCLGGVLWSGLDGSQRATLDAYAAICDRATGTHGAARPDRPLCRERPSGRSRAPCGATSASRWWAAASRSTTRRPTRAGAR